jgi:hypothetical protein
MTLIYVLAAIGAITVLFFGYLALGWAYGSNRGSTMYWHRLYASAYGVGFGFWRVKTVQDVGDVRRVLLPTKRLAEWWVRRYAGEFADIVERGKQPTQ